MTRFERRLTRLTFSIGTVCGFWLRASDDSVTRLVFVLIAAFLVGEIYDRWRIEDET